MSLKVLEDTFLERWAGVYKIPICEQTEHKLTLEITNLLYKIQSTKELCYRDIIKFNYLRYYVGNMPYCKKNLEGVNNLQDLILSEEENRCIVKQYNEYCNSYSTEELWNKEYIKEKV